MNRKISPCTYLQKILFENIIKKRKVKKIKVSKEDFEILEYKDYNKIIDLNYNVSQLKTICRYYKQKVSGNKLQLINLLYNYLKYSLYAIKIQKIYKSYLIKKYLKLKGPALYNRKRCVNSTDFFSLEKIEDIPLSQFISFEDDGQIYGCNVCSLYNLIQIKGNLSTNPYTRKKIEKKIMINLYELIKISNICNIKVNILLEDDTKNFTARKKIEYRTYTIFSDIDEYGLITNANWLLELTKNKMILFVRELYDIFFFRANLTPPQKIKLCPPSGNPFYKINIKIFSQLTTDQILKNILQIINNFIKKGHDRQTKIVGCYYVLGALTLVNLNARESLPWLYESFKHN